MVYNDGLLLRNSFFRPVFPAYSGPGLVGVQPDVLIGDQVEVEIAVQIIVAEGGLHAGVDYIDSALVGLVQGLS